MSDREFDWNTIERDYRAGVLSVTEIARQNSLTEGAIRKRAKRDAWSRDLTARVQEAVRDKLVRDAVRADQRAATSDEIVEAASDRNVAAVNLHRRDVCSLRNRRERLMTQYDALFGPVEGEIVKLDMKEVALAATILESVSRIDEKIVKLERQALSIDTKSGNDPSDPDTSSGAAERVLGKLDRLVSRAPASPQRLN